MSKGKKGPKISNQDFSQSTNNDSEKSPMSFLPPLSEAHRPKTVITRLFTDQDSKAEEEVREAKKENNSPPGLLRELSVDQESKTDNITSRSPVTRTESEEEKFTRNIMKPHEPEDIRPSNTQQQPHRQIVPNLEIEKTEPVLVVNRSRSLSEADADANANVDVDDTVIMPKMNPKELLSHLNSEESSANSSKPSTRPSTREAIINSGSVDDTDFTLQSDSAWNEKLSSGRRNTYTEGTPTGSIILSDNTPSPSTKVYSAEQLSTAQKVRLSADKEKAIVIDCDYVKEPIERWWNSLSPEGKNMFLVNDDEELSTRLKELEKRKEKLEKVNLEIEEINRGLDGERKIGLRDINSSLEETNKKLEEVKKELGEIKQRIEEVKDDLKTVLKNSLDKEHKDLFSKIARPEEHVSVVSMINLFDETDARLSCAVHESLSDLFGLNDIQYPYEKHKKLYLKVEGLNRSGWGNGKGDIVPHSDDIYEVLDTKLLALTVIKDETNDEKGTKTIFYQAKHIFNLLDDEEIARLLEIEATFFSGANVTAMQHRKRNILSYNEDSDDITMVLDFRKDSNIGMEKERMKLVEKTNSEESEANQKLINKLRDFFESLDNIDRYFSKNTKKEDMSKNMSESREDGNQPIATVPKTGTYTIFANEKGLHSREELRLTEEQIASIKEKGNDRFKLGDATDEKRALLRSKGTITTQDDLIRRYSGGNKGENEGR